MGAVWRMTCVVGAVALATGCGSGANAPHDGGPVAGGAGTSTGGTSGGGTSGGGTKGAAGWAGVGGQSGASGGGRDCLPDCIVNLRRGCERPNAGTGATCTYALAADGSERLCFSNGVVEERLSKTDASATDPNFVFYNADGSVCYRVLAVVETTATGQTITTTYLDPAGHTVGELKTVGDSTMTKETATCNGSPVPVPAYDPACGMLDFVDCTTGACP